MLKYAKAYLAKGASVFPVGKDKRPLIDWKIYQERHPTVEELEAWWKQYPDANIGLVTGKISGITVVDCDLGSNPDIFPKTDKIKTGSGGFHLYYQYYPLGNKAAILPHVDIRGDGGYVVAPPSVTSDSVENSVVKKKGGAYTVVEQIGKMPFPIHLFEERKARKVEALLSGVSMSGTRNVDAASVAGKLLARYPEREWETEVWPLFQAWNVAHVNPPMDTRELLTTFKSIAGAEKTKRVKGSVGEIAVEHIGDAVRATLPIDGGFAVFEFSDFDFNARSQDCTLVCHLEEATGKTRTLTSRINLLSMSNKAEFLRQFKESFTIEKKSPWPALLSEIFTAVAQTKTAKYRAERLSEITISPWSYTLEPFIVKNAPNTIFGKGGTGKTFFALRMALSVACGVPLAGCPIPGERQNVLFLDFEDDGSEFKDRLSKLVRGLPPEITRPTDAELDRSMLYFDSKGLPFANLLEPLRKAIAEHNIGLLIIDSAAKACGGKAEDSEVTNKFFNALRSLSVTSLTIAHEAKGALEDNDFVFGSGFWNYSFRNVWKVKVDREKDEDMMHCAFVHTKSNRGKLQGTRAYGVFFGTDFVEMRTEDVSENFVRETGVKNQILNAIFLEMHSVKEIADHLGTTDGNVRTSLNKLKKRNEVRSEGQGKNTLWFLNQNIERRDD